MVREGDSLSLLAMRLLGDGDRWGEIYERNRAVIGEDADLIAPGTELEVEVRNDERHSHNNNPVSGKKKPDVSKKHGADDSVSGKSLRGFWNNALTIVRRKGNVSHPDQNAERAAGTLGWVKQGAAGGSVRLHVET